MDSPVVVASPEICCGNARPLAGRASDSIYRDHCGETGVMASRSDESDYKMGGARPVTCEKKTKLGAVSVSTTQRLATWGSTMASRASGTRIAKSSPELVAVTAAS